MAMVMVVAPCADSATLVHARNGFAPAKQVGARTTLAILDAHQFSARCARRRVAQPLRIPVRAAASPEHPTMANANSAVPPAEDEVPDEPIPAMQQLLDNPFLLLFIGIAMPTVLYIVWGVMEIVGIPLAK
jgi:hypothetical protein